MAEDEPRRKLITFAEDSPADDCEVREEEQVKPRFTHEPIIERSGIRFQRCGGGRRVIRKKKGGD